MGIRLFCIHKNKISCKYFIRSTYTLLRPTTSKFFKIFLEHKNSIKKLLNYNSTIWTLIIRNPQKLI